MTEERSGCRRKKAPTRGERTRKGGSAVPTVGWSTRGARVLPSVGDSDDVLMNPGFVRTLPATAETVCTPRMIPPVIMKHRRACLSPSPLGAVDRGRLGVGRDRDGIGAASRGAGMDKNPPAQLRIAEQIWGRGVQLKIASEKGCWSLPARAKNDQNVFDELRRTIGSLTDIAILVKGRVINETERPDNKEILPQSRFRAPERLRVLVCDAASAIRDGKTVAGHSARDTECLNQGADTYELEWHYRQTRGSNSSGTVTGMVYRLATVSPKNGCQPHRFKRTVEVLELVPFRGGLRRPKEQENAQAA